eukprot:770876-Amorphochlora_amoeboformis.AAC.1
MKINGFFPLESIHRILENGFRLRRPRPRGIQFARNGLTVFSRIETAGNPVLDDSDGPLTAESPPWTPNLTEADLT